MKLSPLHLDVYCLVDFVFQSNKAFDKDKLQTLRADHLKSKPEVRYNTDFARWDVFLHFQYQPPSEANAPYTVLASMYGAFKVDDAYPADKHEKLVATNGPSILFSALRETVQTVTAKAAHGALVFPLVSFVEDKPKAKPGPAALSTGEAPLAADNHEKNPRPEN